MGKIREFFLPHDREYFVKPRELIVNVHEMVDLFEQLVHGFPKLKPRDVEEIISKIHSLENKGDVLSEELIRKLDSAFVTPLDKEDIHHIVSSIEHLTDLVNGVARKLIQYQLEKIPADLEKLARLMRRSSTTSVKLVEALEIHKVNLPVLVREAYKIEREADHVYSEAINQLFDKTREPLEVIKLKEIYESSEKFMNESKALATLIQRVIIKHA